ncbi:TetR/AcrR family transcriptional regulator [Allorhizocola rhizosphaerae]|uniref:TetR/AcrR family transcriptional regulator n=1 Tax=Allorhizocola rhizosphaerae TaxID=1872709 RepID=UPI001B8B32A3|nr:TetR/AcrR family transcriptional regulator [Allorhizocola rhizosphaerae]
MIFDPAERLIDAAFDVLTDGGQQGLTAEAVTAASGVSLGELEAGFGGFDGLVAAVYGRCLGELVDLIVAELHRVRTAEHGVQAVIVTYLRFTEEAPDVARFMLQAVQPGEQIQAQRAAKMQAIVNWFRPHMRSGAMASIPEPLVEMLLIGPVAETARHWLAEAPGVDLDEAIQVLSARVWQSLCPQQTLTLTARQDRLSGLKLVLPEHWVPVHDVLLESFTLAVAGPQADDDEDSPAGRDRANVEERRLWQEATTTVFSPADDSGGEPPAGPPAVYAGLWGDLFEAPPGKQALVELADRIATHYGEYFQFLPANPGHSLDYSRRALTVSGRAAATVSYRLSGQHGESYLRAVIIHRGAGEVSFVLGLSPSGTDRVIIDKILDSVEALEDGAPQNA